MRKYCIKIEDYANRPFGKFTATHIKIKDRVNIQGVRAPPHTAVKGTV
jgi:hypothetical protein